MRSVEVCRRFSLLAAVSIFSIIAPARAVNLVQEFYLPMPEQQIYTANNAIIAGSSANIFSTFSIVVTGNGTVVYYDQWEDGYEVNLASPAQSTTQIWGDGNNANGICPGFTNDPVGLPAGTVITLTNNVTLPRNPGTLLWDARDRVAANKALVISRAGWPVTPGPVFAGAVGVLATIDYGTNYISPVGQNLTNNLFKYVGMFIMAAQNNTTVTIDPTGAGLGTTNIVLNQGESYLVNGGILKGGRVTSTKPIQADLLIGHVGASYASDWFTLYPASAWGNAYYTPVGTSKNGNVAYVYLYNPNSSPITINYNTQVGSGSFSVPGTNGVFQFPMPTGSGASFVSAGGQNFYALSTVAANNSSDTAFNWGFTLVPKPGLTTEATVGWGPGSSDGTVNGSPVWVTPLASTKIYVDYKGDHAGPLTDPNGNKYDTSFTVAALQSQKIFDPSKNQTGMRVYTLDGTLIAAAWGEDPDTAQSGNPYIDAGTTVVPFPVPLLFKSAIIVTDVPPAGLSVGDTILYTVKVDNKGLLPLGNTLVIDAPTTNLTYVSNSTTVDSNSIPDSATGTAFPLDAPGYTIPVILSQGATTFRYLTVVNAGGVVSNSVNIGGTSISSQAFLAPTPTNGASVSLNFSDINGISTSVYAAGANVFVNMTNAVGNTSSNSQQSINVTVLDVTSGDLETITLTETATNTGIFRNITGLPTSTTSGLGQQDGTLHISPGDILSVSYTDPVYFDSATNSASILVPTPNKQLYLSVNGLGNGTQTLNRIDPVAYAHGPIHPSIDIGQGGGGSFVPAAIGVDGSFSTNTAATTLTFNYTTGSGTNRLMLVTVGVQHNSGGAPGVTSVTYNGTNLNQVGSALKGSSNPKYGVYLFSLLNPSPGAGPIQVITTGGDTFIAGVDTFTNVNQAAPLSSTNTATGATTITLNSATNQLVYGTVYFNGAVSLLAGQNPAVQWTNNVNGYIGIGGTMVGSNSATTTMSWTASAYGVGVSINPSTTFVPGGGGGPATNATSFAQTPVFASAFSMPAGGTITITNFITLTNGSLSASPAVTVMLQTNGVSFLTLTNPVFNAGAGVNTNLVWSGTLATNVSIPAGQIITYVISNTVANTAFHVNYDSTNAQSVIVLPASTVIQIATLGVYDAPFPNGSLVTTPVAGNTVYIRAAVTDPFGAYDITSLGLAVIGPDAGSSFTNTLIGANVVTNDSFTKVYEYALATGATAGGYNIAVTANEGTEGVSAVAASGITTIFLDLGTPSTTEFTGGANGIATNSYQGGSVVSIRVTDLNRNTNAAAIDQVIVTVTGASNDLETVTLVETGINTGIFTNSIVSSTSVVGTANNGSLFAPIGSILTASYSDPTDPTDNTSATATIQPAPGIPGVSISKTIVSPSGGQVGVGQSVTYNLQIVNTGSTTLTNVVVMDNFPPAKLGYSTATPAPNLTGSGVLTWNALGNFSPGQSTNLSVTFTTLATGPATNSATANGTSATNTSAVTLLVNNAAVNVIKTLLSPTNTPVMVGSNVVFRITIQNVGNTTINYLPLQDDFSGAYYQYVSSTITNNGSGAGSLIWTNLASPIALATNAIITNDVTMRVVGQGNPANNTATVDFATDIFGNSVPTTSSTIGVTTAAGSITGYVYNDVDTNGVLSVGDLPLPSVTIQLYTDPNGDGDPTDGTLVQLTTTDGSGYYELLNLAVGNYVVVETDLPGYSSTVPANNRLAINLATLTATNNNDFFDYIPAPNLYSTISGTVYYDANGNGTNDLGETGLGNVVIDLVQDVNTNGLADSGESVVASVLTDTNGLYTFAGITPGAYVIRETDNYGYYSTGDSQPPNDNQIALVVSASTVTNNNFFDRPSPTAVNDAGSGLNFVPVILSPLTNDISPNGDSLTISNATSTNGIVVINPGGTNLTFTATNSGTATINYTISDGHGGTSSAVITVTVTELADVAIGKTAPTSVLAISNLTYTISVTNLGPSPANFVTVTDALPAGVSFVSATAGGVNSSGTVTWSLGTLTNSQVTSVSVTVTAPASGTLTNTATGGSPTVDPNPTNNVSPPVTTTVTPIADVAIAKVGPAGVLANSNFSYTITVTNFGPSSASSVVVTDTLPVGVAFVSASGSGSNTSGVVTWNLGTLSSNQVTNVTVTVTATTGGSLTNIATVNSPTSDPNPTNNLTPPVTTTVTPVADVSLVKTAPATVLPGTNFIYTIVVTNAGPSAAANLSVTDNLPANVVLVSATPGSITNGGLLIWTNLGTLGTNSTLSLSVTVTAPIKGDITNTASVGSPTLDPTPTNNITPPVTTAVNNLPPLAVDDMASTPVNIPVTIFPLVNDSDTNGDTLTIINVNPTNGIASFTPTNVLFTPTLNFLGTATVGYTISDGQGGTNSAIIFISVTNRPPVANNDTVAGTNGQAQIISPLGNDTDPDGDALTITVATSTTGIVVINGGNTTLTFTPTNNGTGTINYTISDGHGGSSSAIITVNAGSVADLAIAKVAPASVLPGTNFSYTISVTNFGPSDATSLSVTDNLPANVLLVTATPGYTTGAGLLIWTNLGTLSANSVTNLTLTVTAPVVGSITNTASAGSPTPDPTPTNNVTPPVTSAVINLPPVAVDDTASTPINIPVTIFPLVNDSDTNGDTLTIINVNPTNGIASFTPTNVLFTPTLNFLGTATVGYTISDGQGGTNSAIIFISVTNRPPVANNDTVSGTNGQAQIISPLGNDTDPDGDDLTITIATSTTGIVVINGGNTDLTFTPTNNGVCTINYTISDGHGGSSSAIITVNAGSVADLAIVKIAPANVLAASNFTYTISVTNLGPSDAAGVVVTDTLPAGVTFVSASGNGTNTSGIVTWDLGTLTASQATNLTLTVTAPATGVNLTNVASVSSPTGDPVPTNNLTPPVITGVTPVADVSLTKTGPASVPFATSYDYTLTVSNGGPSTAVSVTVTDSLPAGLVFVTSVPLTTTNASNQVIWNLGDIAAGTTSNLTLTVTSTQRGSLANTASVGGPTLDPVPTNNVTPPVVTDVTNRPPVAINDSSSTPKNVAVTIPVLANDSDPDGDTLTIISVSPTNGTAIISSGTVVFTPTNDFLGTAIIGYTIIDGFGGTNSALIAVTVTNRVPIAVDDSGSTPKNVAVTIPVLANDSDPDGDALTIITVSPTNGLAAISGTDVVFTPTNNFLGTAVVGYTVIDSFGGTNSALIFVTVTNRAPVAQDDSATTSKNVAVTVPVLANDSDPDGDTLTIISVSPTNGLAVISGTNVVFTPTNSFLGNATVGYVIIDGFGGTNSALITISVTNRPPVAANDSASTAKNVAVTIPVLANDSDPDGDTLTIISVSPTNGTANIVGTNVVFTPTGGFTGTGTVGYVIIDGFGGTNSALITINVTNRPPVANAQGVAASFNTAKAITLTGSDPDSDPLTFVIVGTPANGVLSLLDTNTGAVTYTPTNNFTGVDTFTFRVNDGTADSAAATVTITVGTPTVADLAVFKTGPTSGVAGSNLVYTITVTNIGPSIATNVLVVDQLPAGFAFVSATPPGVTVTSNVVNWAAFNLAAHGKTNFTVTATSAEGGTYTNFATATSDAFDPNPTNNNGTLTNSQVRSVISALADVAIFKDGGTNVAAGGLLTYTITATNSGPSTATNVVVKDNLPAGSTFSSASGSYTLSNNVVSWAALVLTNGASVNYTLSLTAPLSGTFTNIALSTSTTPDPNPTNNNGSFNKSRVATKVVPVADLVVLLYGPTNAVVGSNFVYSLILSNAGPSTASNAVASDMLPTNLVFVSATSGGTVSNGIVTWPIVKSLGVGGTTNYSVTVYSPLVGTFTNVGSAVSTTLDPNPTNNTGVLAASQVQTTVTFAQFGWLAGTPVLNPQTGLYEEIVTVTNAGSGTVAGFQMYVTVLTPNVYLWNATGTNASGPYVQYSFPVDPSNHVSLTLEFYDPFRVAFTNTLRVVPVIPAPINITGTNGSVNITNVFTDTRTANTRFVIEFASVPGKTYTIIYSSDMVTWKVATPSVTASANVTQWYDDGPPKTESQPLSVGTRFYRVIKN